MAFDLDPFDDIFPDGAAKTVRAGGKFQPKAKLQPRKESSASVPSRHFAISENELTETPSLGTERASKNKDCFGNLEGENADIFLGLESIDDFLPRSTNVMVDAASKYPPEGDMSAQLGNKFSTPCPVNTDEESYPPPSEEPTVPISGSRNTEEGLGIRVFSPGDHAAREGNTAHACRRTELRATLNPCSEAAISVSNGDLHIENGRFETEEAEAFPCLEALDIMSESTIRSGPRTGKFQPKPKVHICKEKHSTTIPIPDAVESVSCPEDAQSVPSQTEYMDEGSIPAFPPDDVLDFSSLGFSDSIPTDPTSELPVNEEPTNLTETSQSDVATRGGHPEAVPEMPGNACQRAKRGKRKTHTVSNLSLKHQKASTSGQGNENGRSLGRQRKRINLCELVDESEDEGLGDVDSPAECPSDSVINEDNDNDEEYLAENETQNKRVRRNLRKPVAEKEKPIRKRKKTSEVLDHSAQRPSKKFSHSTRRNRRRVDKALLEIPEHEINFQQLPIKDLIMLAEYNERMMNKEAATSETPSMNQSAANSSAHYNEDETFASEQGKDSNDEEANPRVQESSTYINYQTYMDKTRGARWSKLDTESFYEAVRQFGTDLSMIQQLFPGRTRRQVKLKYKKEERQHPLRLHEALTNRAKDHSHFELVIEQLQQIAAQKKQNSNIDDSDGLTREEAEDTAPESNEEVAKSEQFEEEVQDVEADVPAVESSEKTCDSEDDFYRWSQYKSEL